MSDGRIGNSNQYLQISGVVSAPAYSFASDNDTGIYRIGANNIGIAANGSKVLDISSTAVTITPATTLSAALTYGGVTLNNAVTGTGNMVLSASPTLTGTLTAAAANFSGAVTQTIGSTSRMSVISTLNGAESSFVFTGKDSGGAANSFKLGLGITADSEATLYDVTNSATVFRYLRGGAFTFTPGVTMNAALTYGGVTLSNSVTGTGSMVLSASPALTGTPNTTNNTNGVSSFSVLNPNAGASASSRLYLGNNQASTRAYLIEWGSGFGGSGQYRSDGLTIENGGTGGIVLSADNASGIIGAWMNGAYAWYTGTDRSFLVGTTTNGGWGTDAKIEAQTSTGAGVSGYATGSGGQALRGRVDNTGADLGAFYYTTTKVGSITTNGTNTAYNTSSDARLKDNIADADDAGAIIDALRVRKWDWKSNGAHQSYGFVAQEEALVYADAVTQGDDGEEITRQWARDDSKLVPLLVKELQSVRARLAALEA